MVPRVVLVTDGLAELDPASAKLLSTRLADAAGQGIGLEVIVCPPTGGEAGGWPQLDELARAGRGAVRRAGDVDQIQWALLEILTGRSQLVARNVSLKVTFNKTSVIEYRLLGHEATDMAGLKPAPLEADFYSGQSGTALYEFRLWPQGSDEVASVEVAWRDQPAVGALAGGSRARWCTRLRGASSPRPCRRRRLGSRRRPSQPRPPNCCATRRSRAPPNPGSWSRLREVLGQTDSSLPQRPTFVDLVSLIQSAEKARLLLHNPKR